MLEGGADIRLIQAMLGHESLETTQIYTRVSAAKLVEIHAARHPRARLVLDGAVLTAALADDGEPLRPIGNAEFLQIPESASGRAQSQSDVVASHGGSQFIAGK